MRERRIAAAALLWVGLAAALSLVSGYQRHGADFCHCKPENKPVCGRDLQTYANECILNCAAQRKLKVG